MRVSRGPLSSFLSLTLWLEVVSLGIRLGGLQRQELNSLNLRGVALLEISSPSAAPITRGRVNSGLNKPGRRASESEFDISATASPLGFQSGLPLFVPS